MAIEDEDGFTILPSPSRDYAAAAAVDHRDHFWGIARLKVENTRFQLPLSPFVKGSKFFPSHYGLFAEPAESGVFSSFITLGDVDLQSFEWFIDALLPVYSLGPKSALDKAQWITVLRLATRWQFNEVRKSALDALDRLAELSAMERTKLAKELAIPDWLIKGYKGLIEGLQVSEVAEFGPQLEERMGSLAKEAAILEWDVVFKLQSIVVSRQHLSLRGLPIGTIEKDIMACELLRREYERMMERSKAYMTEKDIEEELRKIAEEEQKFEGELARLVRGKEEKAQEAARAKRREEEVAHARELMAREAALDRELAELSLQQLGRSEQEPGYQMLQGVNAEAPALELGDPRLRKPQGPGMGTSTGRMERGRCCARCGQWLLMCEC